jgi:hypothetical protein
MSDDTVFIGYGGGLFATVMGGKQFIEAGERGMQVLTPLGTEVLEDLRPGWPVSEHVQSEKVAPKVARPFSSTLEFTVRQATAGRKRDVVRILGGVAHPQRTSSLATVMHKEMGATRVTSYKPAVPVEEICVGR